jgi:hypothetical protein
MERERYEENAGDDRDRELEVAEDRDRGGFARSTHLVEKESLLL